MKTSQFYNLIAILVCILAVACKTNPDVPTKIDVDKDITVTIYATTDNEGVTYTIPPCLLKETAHVSVLLHYPCDKGVTMPFNISDTTKYAEITSNNLYKRIAIAIDGQVVSTPVVKTKLNNGACSVVLDDTQVAKLFPNVNIKEFKSTYQ